MVIGYISYDRDVVVILRAGADERNTANVNLLNKVVKVGPAFGRLFKRIECAYDDIDKIEVSRTEATEGFACNLVSTGETVIMSARAPQLRAELEKRGFTVITPEITELAKGGGYIRCTTLTLG